MCIINKNFFSKKILTIFLTCLYLTSCSSPLQINKSDTINIHFPSWPPDDLPYPQLTKWKIIVTNKYGSKVYNYLPKENTSSIEVIKDELTSILLYPITTSEYFYPAGCVYPSDFFTTNSITPKWEDGAYSKIVKSALETENFYKYEKLLYCFNWNKLKEHINLQEKKSIEKILSIDDSSNQILNNISTSYDIEVPSLLKKITTPSQRITLDYCDTYTYKAKKLFNMNVLENDIILSNYIPLNNIFIKKGYLTVQKKSLNSPIAFYINNNLTYFRYIDLNLPK